MKNGWEIKKLKDIAEYTIGLTYSPTDVGDQGTVVLRSSNVQDGKLDLTDIVRVKAKIKPHLYVQPGDILMCSRNGSKRLVGKATVIGNLSEQMTFGTFMTVIRSQYNPYLWWFFVSDLFREQIGIGENPMINQITKYMLDDIDVPVPPIEEQRRIVAILDEAFACIDKAKANTEKNIQNARELFDSYLNNIFSNPGSDWETKTLTEIGTNLDSLRRPVTRRDRVAGKYPYYGASGIVDYVGDYIFDEDLLLISEDGANLVARTYPIAFSITGKSWVNNHAHVIRFSNMATQRLVEVYLNSISLIDYISGMAQPKLNQAMLNKVPIPLPPQAKQEEIFSRIDELESITASLAETYSSKQANLDEAKKTILQEAFSGEIRNQ